MVVVGRGRPPPRPGGPDPVLLVLALLEDGPLPPGVTVVARVQATKGFRSVVDNPGHGIAPGLALPDDQEVALTYDYHEAGRLLGNVSERTIRRLVARGELPVIDVGGQRRIARADLERYVDAHRRAVASAGSQGAA